MTKVGQFGLFPQDQLKILMTENGFQVVCKNRATNL